MKTVLLSVARGYILILIALQVFLLLSSLVLHLTVLVGIPAPFREFGLAVFRTAVVATIPVFAFIRDYWTDQIKNCPVWMWKAALACGIYGLLTFVLLLWSRTDWATAVMLSGFPLGFETISFCVLYPIAWQGYLTDSEVKRRALHSLGAVVVVTLGFFAYEAGYLRRSTT
jgi:hypothetical protein